MKRQFASWSSHIKFDTSILLVERTVCRTAFQAGMLKSFSVLDVMTLAVESNADVLLLAMKFRNIIGNVYARTMFSLCS